MPRTPKLQHLWRRLRAKAWTLAGASLRTTIDTKLKEATVPIIEIDGRIKRLWSISQKLKKQRIALARCFLRTEQGADLLLLDEPTAHLDAPTELRTLAAIRQLSVGRFVLMVAHRPSAIDFADRTVEVGAGIPEERPMTSAALS